jgi:phosphopantetheine adenylyltransferase
MGPLSFLGGIVALGKFDALHVGHRELAIKAAKVGRPFLLSFVGMVGNLGMDIIYLYYLFIGSLLSL